MSPGARSSYHHGDLRDALVTAAEQLMAQQSAWTFTLREVARAAGVSHNAPYNHFADRRALLAAVAARAFAELTIALNTSLQAVDASDTAASIRAIARAYVTFAVTHPSRFRLMFSADLAGCEDTAFREAGERAFAVLRDLIAKGIAAGRVRDDPNGTHALAAWSLVHGLSTLVLDGRVAGVSAEGPSIDGLADTVAATLVDGLVPTGEPATRE